jgi:hypothetical protein
MAMEVLPKVTPSLLRGIDQACPRRLALDFNSEDRGSSSPVNRARLRDPFLAGARRAHAELRAPELAWFPAPTELEPEEQAVFKHAARWYVEMYGDRPALLAVHDCDRPSTSAARQLRIGGWIDLTVVDADDALELRQLQLWDGRGPSESPLETEACRLAVLRLSRWVGDRPLRVSWADLVHGRLVERVVDVASELPALRDWFDERVAVLRERADEQVAVPDAGDCGRCVHVSGCPAHPRGANGISPRGDARPGIITLSPTSLDRWNTCRRAWWLDLLEVPASDSSVATEHGQLVHSLLRFIHRHGSCTDPENVEHALAAHSLSSDALVREEIERHVRRCPAGAEALGHEQELARFHRTPLPLFMATARIEAVWIHDDILDARDYKTGLKISDRVADDPKARLQAWVLAPVAHRLGLRLRLSYEQLSPDVVDDPVYLEPEEDDLAAFEEELRCTVAAIWSEERFGGVSDAPFCRRCDYRSICPDSESPAVPSWPVPPEDG